MSRSVSGTIRQKIGKTYIKVLFVGFLCTALGAVVFYPSVTSADFISIFSSVFVNKEVKRAEEIKAPANLQTMSLLTAPLNPIPATTTKNIMASAMVDDTALTNENTGVAGAAGSVDPYASDRISLYTVHPGDTISQIAEMYNVSVSTILWANDLKKGASLQPNQVIVILPISGIKYTVKKGDTLASVAKAYRADVGEITNFNDLEDGAKLVVGSEIIIPNAEMGEIITSTGKPAVKKPAGTLKNGRFVAGGGTSSHLSDPNGYFTRPVSGGVRTQGLHGNNGVDLASSYGTSILAAADGQVVISRYGGWNGGYGNYIVIKHSNGTQTLYAHLSQNNVSAGQHVSQGQTIGRMGSTGDSTGVHLHFEIRGGRNPF